MTERETYFKEARSWAEDSRARTSRSKQIAWTIAGIAVGAAAFEAVALAMLTPLKTVQPITLLVDRQTGFVQALDPNTPQRVSADAALTDAYLAQYVSAREGFDRATLQVDYRRVALWSAGRARASYLSGIAATNPASPIQSLPGGTLISVRVKSVSRLQSGVSLVRFDTQRVDRNGQAEAPRPWISVVRFRYSDAPMAFGDRLVNPLGFQVTGYRRDAEAPPAPEVVAPVPVVSTPSVPAEMPVIETRVSPPMPTRTPVPRRMSTERALGGVGGQFIAQREVLANQIPMGSPLGPGSAIPAVPVTGQQP
ncbi:virB8 family protein [Sphingomonas sp. Leaf37]|uniref:virB8 family protein n=1 Tax=Sphingomonas sp. Leaf37 TaxID=2876552 RepID=UPI001E29682C|nr:type IV secretion system protein [Sphingomonas sp. Leaf37]